MSFKRISKLSITILLLSVFLYPNSVYSQYTDFEISDIYFSMGEEIDIEETRYLRDGYIGHEITMIEYPNSDLIELEGLTRIISDFVESPPNENLSLNKVGWFGNSYRKEKVYSNESDEFGEIEIISTKNFSLKTSFFTTIDGEFSLRGSLSDEVYLEERDISFSTYELIIEMKIIDD